MMLYQQAANERKCPGKVQGKCFNYFETFSKMVDNLFKKNKKMVDKQYMHPYNTYCSVVKPTFARVAQWWSIALPRRGSRVRIPSRAFFIASEI